MKKATKIYIARYLVYTIGLIILLFGASLPFISDIVYITFLRNLDHPFGGLIFSTLFLTIIFSAWGIGLIIVAHDDLKP